MRTWLILGWILCVNVSWGQDMDHALIAYQQQDYISAYTLYDECVSVDSLELNCIEKAAACAQKLGNFKKAKELFLHLEKTDTTNTTCLIQLATIFEIEKNTPKTIKYYSKLSSTFPANPIYKRKLAKQYQIARLVPEAFTYYAQANALNPSDILTITGLAELYTSTSQYEKADSILSQGLLIDDENINIHLLYAQTKYRQKQYDTTTFILHKIRGEIDFSNYYNKMFGYSYLQIDSLDQAIVWLEKSLVNEGNPENALYYLGIAYEKKEDIETSLHFFNKAAEAGISTNQKLYHRNLARIYNEKGDLKNAISHYQDAYKYGEEPEVIFLLARASDEYYADKSIAMNYYKRYGKTSHNNPEYKRYSRERKLYLKEQIHFNSLKN